MQFVSELLFYESYGFRTAMIIIFLIVCENVYMKAKTVDFFSLWQKIAYILPFFCFFEFIVHFVVQRPFLSFYECLMSYFSSILFFPIAYSFMCFFQRNSEYFRG